jgi:chromosome segregation ATPase
MTDIAAIRARHEEAERGGDAVVGAHHDRGLLLAEIARLTAPVDVEAEVDDLLIAINHAWEHLEVREVVTPLVTEKARLQREVADRAEIERNLRESAHILKAQHGEARAEIARLEKENEKTREAMNEWAESDARARAEVERLKKRVAALMEHVATVEAVAEDYVRRLGVL